MKMADSCAGQERFAKTHSNTAAFNAEFFDRPVEKVGERVPIAECELIRRFLVDGTDDKEMMRGVLIGVEVLGQEPAVAAFQNRLGVPAHILRAERAHLFFFYIF